MDPGGNVNIAGHEDYVLDQALMRTLLIDGWMGALPTKTEGIQHSGLFLPGIITSVICMFVLTIVIVVLMRYKSPKKEKYGPFESDRKAEQNTYS